MDDGYSRELNSSGDNFGDEHLKKRNLSGSDSSKEIRKAVEECLLASSSTLDVSRKNIKHLTEEIYRLPNIKYFHLEGNVISTIPEDLFQKLPHLVWLDLRYNKIKALPPGIGYHRQLKTLLLERNPIKELPAELGNLTSLTALNLRHCPLEFPPKDVIQKGLKSILCFLRDSGNGKLPCMEPATSGFGEPPEPLEPNPCVSCDLSTLVGVETPPVEKLHLSELLQSSLDASEEWPNEEEKLRFHKLKEEIIKYEKEEFLADKHVGTIQDFTEAGRRHGRNESARLCRTILGKRAEKCRSVAEKELKEEQTLLEQRKKQLTKETVEVKEEDYSPYVPAPAVRGEVAETWDRSREELQNHCRHSESDNKEMLQEWRSQAKLMKERREMFRFSPTKADTVPKSTPYAAYDIGYYAVTEGAEKPNHTPAKMEERLLKVKVEAAKYLREQKLEQRLRQHMQMMKARREKLTGTSQVEVKEAKRDTETVEDLQTKLRKPKGLPPPQEYRLVAFTGETPPDPPRIQTPKTFSSGKFRLPGIVKPEMLTSSG